MIARVEPVDDGVTVTVQRPGEDIVVKCVPDPEPVWLMAFWDRLMFSGGTSSLESWDRICPAADTTEIADAIRRVTAVGA